MSGRLRFGRFEFQVRLVLVLLVLFLAALDVLNLYLLDQARRDLRRADQARVEAQARQAVAALGEGTLRAIVASRGGIRATVNGALLRRNAVRLGLSRLVLLDQAGREIVAGMSAGDSASRYLLLPEDRRASLVAGRVATLQPDEPSAGEAAQWTVYVPLLDSGGLVGIMEAGAPAPELRKIERSFHLVLMVHAASVALVGGLVLLFANWVSRPYRRLAAAAGEAGWRVRGSGEDPDELVAAFRAIVAKLKDQDEALEALEREGGGLGVLVRFASNAARAMPTGVLVLDRQARVAALNPAAQALLGCTGVDFRGSELGALPCAVEGLQPLVRSCLDQGQGSSRQVLEMRTEDGKSGHLGVGVTPALGPRGDVAGVLVLLSDLTEIRQLQDQVRVRENLAAVGQLSAGIAHEFRNALGTILGYARILEKQGDPRVRGPVREILKEVDSLRAVVDQLLLYARSPDPAREPVDVGAVVRGCATVAPGSVDVEVRGEFGRVLGDEGLLRRAFANLFQNAADASCEERPRLRVRVTGRRHPTGRSLQVEVEDDGPGIPAELRTQVFVPFYTTRAKGTGLGLALVQRTVVDLGGTIEVAESSRGGALFRIRLPLLPQEAARDRVPIAARGAIAQRSDREG